MKSVTSSTCLAKGDPPRVTFGMIVLNGEPFTRYNLRSLYPWAHQIIVVEGACPGAASVATPDGHSMDGTLEVLRAFIRDEDPEGKVTLVTAEDEGHADGFWSEKDEMSQAYAKRATGDFLWQVDVDEFYTEESFREIMKELAKGVDAVSFPQITFWGSPAVVAHGFYTSCYPEASEIHRIFRWEPGSSYKSHRPPTVLNRQGIDVRSKNWVRAAVLRSSSVFMLHYSLLLPQQVLGKSEYYRSSSWSRSFMSRAGDWAHECWLELRHPFRVHNVYDHLSWLERYSGPWPAQIRAMWKEIELSNTIALRDMSDAEALLTRPWYRAATALLRALAPLVRVYVTTRRRIRGTANAVLRGRRTDAEPR